MQTTFNLIFFLMIYLNFDKFYDLHDLCITFKRLGFSLCFLMLFILLMIRQIMAAGMDRKREFHPTDLFK